VSRTAPFLREVLSHTDKSAFEPPLRARRA
jgi:hypothetical protein